MAARRLLSACVRKTFNFCEFQLKIIGDECNPFLEVAHHKQQRFT